MGLYPNDDGDCAFQPNSVGGDDFDESKGSVSYNLTSLDGKQERYTLSFCRE